MVMVLFTLLIIVSECNSESKEEEGLRRKAKWERNFSAVFVCFMRFLSGMGFYWGRRLIFVRFDDDFSN